MASRIFIYVAITIFMALGTFAMIKNSHSIEDYIVGIGMMLVYGCIFASFILRDISSHNETHNKSRVSRRTK